MNKLFAAIFFIFLSLLSANHLFAQETNQVDVLLFYGQGCPHCARMKAFLETMEEKYPELNLVEYEIYFNDENRELYMELTKSFGYEQGGVPVTFIDDRIIVGFGTALVEPFEREIQRCIEEECASPLAKLQEEQANNEQEQLAMVSESDPDINPAKTELVKRLTVPAVLSAAAVDAINPCAFAVLIILLTTVLASKSKRKALGSGLAFSGSIFISYLMMGLGLYSAIQISGFTHIFFMVVAVLAILIGLFNLKDYLWYGKWFVMEVPMSWRPKLKTFIRGVTSIPGAFLIGFVVSLFLLPCTSGPYIIILGLLAETATRNIAFAYLLLYNFIFILPMLIITMAIYWGFTTTEKAEEWRTKRLKVLHLIAGIIILLLGIGMMSALVLGIV